MFTCCFQTPREPQDDDSVYMSQRQPGRVNHAAPGGYMRRKSSASGREDEPTKTATLAGYQPPPRWVKDTLVEACARCNTQFDLLTRKHHCRGCGLVFCGSCTSQFDRVVKFGLLEPVRLCGQCAGEAKTENDFYETHLPLLEAGELFNKYGLLRKRIVQLKFVRAKNIFQYHKVDADTRQQQGESFGSLSIELVLTIGQFEFEFGFVFDLAGDIKAISLDEITEVREVAADKDNADVGLIVVAGDQEHRFDATTAAKQQQWVAAIRSARAVREAMLATEREKRAQLAEKENEEIRRMSENLQRMEERKASFQEDRIRRRAEKRESLRAKYNLAPSAS